MSDMSLEIVLIVILILVNGVFSLAEFAMASSRKARLQQRVPTRSWSQTSPGAS